MKPTRQHLQELLRIVAATEPQEIDCAEFLARVGPFLEVLERGEQPPPELRLVAQHATICAECSEELDALFELMDLQPPDAVREEK